LKAVTGLDVRCYTCRTGLWKNCALSKETTAASTKTSYAMLTIFMLSDHSSKPLHEYSDS